MNFLHTLQVFITTACLYNQLCLSCSVSEGHTDVYMCVWLMYLTGITGELLHFWYWCCNIVLLKSHVCNTQWHPAVLHNRDQLHRRLTEPTLFLFWNIHTAVVNIEDNTGQSHLIFFSLSLPRLQGLIFSSSWQSKISVDVENIYTVNHSSSQQQPDTT